ncbi:MAG: 5'-methylthioadenosine/adenosylhomocysteine nucleosidase [Polaromonas sp.]|nr:5'-methylthioadenosine/adenosylhomocysteine nucleosidase [Polaromonas sp.]
MKTTAILSALAEEQQGLLEQLQHPEKTSHAGRDFWTGELHGQPVVLAISRIGKVAAATTATALIERFSAGRIVFTGVAGGLGEGVQVGDVVVADAFIQHDLDASPIFPRYEVPLYGKTRFACDPALHRLLLQASRTGLDSLALPASTLLHHGLVASGDRFVSGAQESLALRSALQQGRHEVLAVEMEGAAVAQVCFDYGVPFAAVRTISDRADDTAHVDFPVFVRDVASLYAQEIVRQLLDLLPKR